MLGGSSLASPITVVAECPCEVLLLPYDRLLQPGSDPARQQVLQNLVRTISDKYFLLSRRVDLLILKSLRAKVCAYLLSEAEYHHSMTFTIPYSRIQLADYLNCDRSALSRELSLMQRDGLLETYRSSFKIMDAEALRGWCCNNVQADTLDRHSLLQRRTGAAHHGPHVFLQKIHDLTAAGLVSDQSRVLFVNDGSRIRHGSSSPGLQKRMSISSASLRAGTAATRTPCWPA